MNYSEVLLASHADNKGRHVAYEFTVWEREGTFYGLVQKGVIDSVNGFKKFGAAQSAKKYKTEKQAITAARNAIKQRIADLLA